MALTKIPGELFDVDDLDLSDVGTIALDAIKGEADTDTSITFSGSNVITIKAANANQITFIDGAIVPSTDNDIDLGTSSVEFKDAFFDGTVTSDAFAGPLTGNVTGDVSGSSGSTTGLAATATALATGRTIGGTSFDGTANIVPATVTVADTTDTSSYVALFESATGDLGPKTDAAITYNAGTGALTATSFVGALTGNVTGNASGTALTVTQAAQTAITSLGTLTGLTVSGSTTLAATSFGDADITNVGALSVDSIAGDADVNTSITFSGNDIITIANAGTNQITFNDGSILPVADSDIDLGSASYEFKDGYFDGTLHTDAINLNGTAVTADGTELNYVDGVTSAIQTQMDTKASTGKAIAMAIVFG